MSGHFAYSDLLGALEALRILQARQGKCKFVLILAYPRGGGYMSALQLSNCIVNFDRSAHLRKNPRACRQPCAQLVRPLCVEDHEIMLDAAVGMHISPLASTGNLRTAEAINLSAMPPFTSPMTERALSHFFAVPKSRRGNS